MLKVVVFDGGHGGELFADYLAEVLPVIEIVRLIDWRNANALTKNAHRARKVATNALKPYIGKVDLIIFANHLLSLTSLKYFQRKYPNQKFLGLELAAPDTFADRDMLILTTRAVARTSAFHKFNSSLKRTTKTVTPNAWSIKIDDGDLRPEEIKYVIENVINENDFYPKEIVLACSQFNDIKTELKNIFGAGLKIYDSFDNTVREACHILGFRGGLGKK